jgi:WD40 repeat protein
LKINGGGETGNMVRAIAWSRDGKLIATTDVSRTIQIWDATTGKFVKSLTGHGSAVLDVVWSDDSKTLTSVSQDKTIKRWDISTGKEIETIGINLPHTLRVSWSPDGKKLAAGEWFNLNNNQRIQVWDINLGN